MEYVSSVERILEERIMQRAIAEGELSALIRSLHLLLKQRFGNVPQAIMDRVNSSTKEDAESWMGRILGANSLDDVFQDHLH